MFKYVTLKFLYIQQVFAMIWPIMQVLPPLERPLISLSTGLCAIILNSLT